MTIRTSAVFAPVPFGSHTWAAWDDSKAYETGDAVGFGATKAKAIANLIKQTEKVT